MKLPIRGRFLLILPVILCALLAGGATRIVQDVCGPFTDVSPAFCPFVLELYYLGITAGTSATTFSPDDPLTRGQGAVFVAKGLNQSLARSSRRAALGQWWTTQGPDTLGRTFIGLNLGGVQSDGADLWLSNGGTVFRVRASDGQVLNSWTPTATGAQQPLVAMGSIFFLTHYAGDLYRIDPANPANPPELVADLGFGPTAIAFDGARFWTSNNGSITLIGSVSIVTPGPTLPWSTSTVTTGFQQPGGVVFDGNSTWVVDQGNLLRLDASGGIVQTVSLNGAGFSPIFDGKNLWVCTNSSVTVVDASSGQVIATLTGNGLTIPWSIAFDGRRVLVANQDGVSLWDAASLQPLGSFLSGVTIGGVCSDGVSFWITLPETGELARF